MKLSTSTEWLFFHLWKKNPETGTSCPGVFLVDTVIYRWAQPYFWYFTNRDGEIIRKTKERIDTEHVKETFMYNVPDTGVVAQYLISQDTSQAASQKNFNKNSSEGVQMGAQQGGSEQEVIQFEYFDEENFNLFLHQREKNLNAILQKFIQPKSGRNSLIKVSWSPQFCLLYRKTNVNTLDNLKVPIHEKLCTFEGPEYLAIQDSITSPILSADLEQMCVNIVKHIQDISGGNIQISRMVLYFKLDDRNRLWLLFCTGLKIRERFQDYSQKKQTLQQQQTSQSGGNGNSNGINQANLLGSQRTLSPVLRMSKTQHSLKHTTGALNINYGFVKNMQNNFKKNCSNCEAATTDLYDLKLSNIIESFEQGTVDNSKTILPDEILKLIEQNKAKKLRRLNQNKKKKHETDQRTLTKDEELKELFKYLDEEHQNNDIDLNMMPALVVKVWGNLTAANYSKIKSNRSWLELTTKVCDECYLDYTKCSLETDFIRETKNNSDRLKIDAANKEKPQMFSEFQSRKISQASISTGKQKQTHNQQGNNNLNNIQSANKQDIYNLDSPAPSPFNQNNNSNNITNNHLHVPNTNSQENNQNNQNSKGKKSFFFNDPKMSLPQSEDHILNTDENSQSGVTRLNNQNIPNNLNKNQMTQQQANPYDMGQQQSHASNSQQNTARGNNNRPSQSPSRSGLHSAQECASNEVKFELLSKPKKKSSQRMIRKPQFFQDPGKIYMGQKGSVIRLPQLSTKHRNSIGFSDSSSLSGSTQSKLSHDFLISTISSMKNSIKDIEDFNQEDYN